MYPSICYTNDLQIRLVDHLIDTERSRVNGHKNYSIWDAYPHADLITYPSVYEGFGNALLEAIYFRRLVVVNRYPVYNADIKPLGFEFIELDGFVDDNAVETTRQLLSDSAQVKEIVGNNFKIAREHFSLEVLEQKLKEVLNNF